MEAVSLFNIPVQPATMDEVLDRVDTESVCVHVGQPEAGEVMDRSCSFG